MKKDKTKNQLTRRTFFSVMTKGIFTFYLGLVNSKILFEQPEKNITKENSKVKKVKAKISAHPLSVKREKIK